MTFSMASALGRPSNGPLLTNTPSPAYASVSPPPASFDSGGLEITSITGRS